MTTIVIAKYKENENCLRWIEDIDQKNVCVYDKSKNMSNIGRESHTYLWHIVHNYDNICQNPEKVTLFTQANILDHFNTISYKNNIKTICEEARKKGISECIAKTHNDVVHPKNSPHYNFRMYKHTTPNEKNWPFGYWFEQIIGQPFPNPVKWFLGAIFAVKNERIANKPLSYYQLLLKEFDNGVVDPEIGHFFERSWYYVFSNIK